MADDGFRFKGKNFRSEKELDALPEHYRAQWEEGNRPVDPGFSSPDLAPNAGRVIVPHVATFSGIVSTLAKTYKNPDEAIRHSVANAAMMRRDPMVMGPLLARQQAVALLDWSIEPEDKTNSEQVEVAKLLENMIAAIPNFVKYRRNLLEAIWYGRYGIQHRWGFSRTSRGSKVTAVRSWVPVNGDKILFRYEDYTGKYDHDEIGIKVSPAHVKNDIIAGRQDLEWNTEGSAVFLRRWERARIALHKHLIMDGDYEDPTTGGMVHGVGIRHFIYWMWFQKQETMAQLAELVDRSGMGFTIYRYPAGDDQAKQEMLDIANKQATANQIVMPHDPMNPAYGIEQIPPNTQGVTALMELIDGYFGAWVIRFILGQTSTVRAEPSGLGGGQSDLHRESFVQIVRYDAENLDDTLTRDLVQRYVEFNFPSMKHVAFKFRSHVPDPNVNEKLAGLQAAWTMGAKIKANDIMSLVGLTLAGEDDVALYNPELQSAIMQLEQQGGVAVDPEGGEQGPMFTPEEEEEIGAMLDQLEMSGEKERYAADEGLMSERAPDLPSSPDAQNEQVDKDNVTAQVEAKAKTPAKGAANALQRLQSKGVKTEEVEGKVQAKPEGAGEEKDPTAGHVEMPTYTSEEHGLIEAKLDKAVEGDFGQAGFNDTSGDHIKKSVDFLRLMKTPDQATPSDVKNVVANLMDFDSFISKGKVGEGRADKAEQQANAMLLSSRTTVKHRVLQALGMLSDEQLGGLAPKLKAAQERAAAEYEKQFSVEGEPAQDIQGLEELDDRTDEEIEAARLQESAEAQAIEDGQDQEIEGLDELDDRTDEEIEAARLQENKEAQDIEDGKESSLFEGVSDNDLVDQFNDLQDKGANPAMLRDMEEELVKRGFEIAEENVDEGELVDGPSDEELEEVEEEGADLGAEDPSDPDYFKNLGKKEAPGTTDADRDLSNIGKGETEDEPTDEELRGQVEASDTSEPVVEKTTKATRKEIKAKLQESVNDKVPHVDEGLRNNAADNALMFQRKLAGEEGIKDGDVGAGAKKMILAYRAAVAADADPSEENMEAARTLFSEMDAAEVVALEGVVGELDREYTGPVDESREASRTQKIIEREDKRQEIIDQVKAENKAAKPKDRMNKEEMEEEVELRMQEMIEEEEKQKSEGEKIDEANIAGAKKEDDVVTPTSDEKGISETEGEGAADESGEVDEDDPVVDEEDTEEGEGVDEDTDSEADDDSDTDSVDDADAGVDDDSASGSESDSVQDDADEEAPAKPTGSKNPKIKEMSQRELAQMIKQIDGKSEEEIEKSPRLRVLKKELEKELDFRSAGQGLGVDAPEVPNIYKSLVKRGLKEDIYGYLDAEEVEKIRRTALSKSRGEEREGYLEGVIKDLNERFAGEEEGKLNVSKMTKKQVKDNWPEGVAKPAGFSGMKVADQRSALEKALEDQSNKTDDADAPKGTEAEVGSDESKADVPVVESKSDDEPETDTTEDADLTEGGSVAPADDPAPAGEVETEAQGEKSKGTKKDKGKLTIDDDDTENTKLFKRIYQRDNNVISRMLEEDLGEKDVKALLDEATRDERTAAAKAGEKATAEFEDKFEKSVELHKAALNSGKKVMEIYSNIFKAPPVVNADGTITQAEGQVSPEGAIEALENLSDKSLGLLGIDNKDETIQRMKDSPSYTQELSARVLASVLRESLGDGLKGKGFTEKEIDEVHRVMAGTEERQAKHGAMSEPIYNYPLAKVSKEVEGHLKGVQSIVPLLERSNLSGSQYAQRGMKALSEIDLSDKVKVRMAQSELKDAVAKIEQNFNAALSSNAGQAIIPDVDVNAPIEEKMEAMRSKLDENDTLLNLMEQVMPEEQFSKIKGDNFGAAVNAADAYVDLAKSKGVEFEEGKSKAENFAKAFDFVHKDLPVKQREEAMKAVFIGLIALAGIVVVAGLFKALAGGKKK